MMNGPSETAAPPSSSPLRALLGGALMGLANLVPGVSGGTMLLAVGIYPRFVEAVAEVTRLRLKRRHLLTLAYVVGAGGLAILLLAGPTRDLVVNHRWVMYSLFIGLTLGGVPIVWKLARPLSPGVRNGALAGLLLMVATALFSPAGSGSAQSTWLMLGLAGLAGSGAMILPGISGGYVLLLMGQYVPVLSAISDFKNALLADGGPDVAAATAAFGMLLPVGVGILLGVTLISNVLEWALSAHRKTTLGFLLGLLLGAVLGLWPFQRGVEPHIGMIVKGQAVSAETLRSIEPEDWPLERFSPSARQLADSAALIVVGFGVTMLIGRVGSGRERS